MDFFLVLEFLLEASALVLEDNVSLNTPPVPSTYRIVKYHIITLSHYHIITL